jgi:D-alanyl-lipoteichoic acid acyltransferase DltB (MBOAT superfamily)
LAWTSTLAYTLQLYFDFSGYIDMAIGLAAMFGIRLPINFNSPYKSRSISEFWTRWHITLSRFLRDYVYIPLGGNRHGAIRRYINLLLTMLLGGLWHGASFNFVLWGALHGGYLCINHAWRRFGAPIIPIPSSFAWGITFFAVVLAWVPFRATDLAASGRIYMAMVDVGSFDLPPRDVIFRLAVGLGIVLLMPNTQQIMATARPALGTLTLPRGTMSALIWRPTLAWSLASGVLLTFALAASWPHTTPPPFLYFNF